MATVLVVLAAVGCGRNIPSDVPAASEGVRVIAARPNVAGYDRSCGRGHTCVFGPAWSDDVDTSLGHDGCDQRSGVLQRDLRDVTIRPRTRGCVVVSGVLVDPYSGSSVTYRRGQNPPEVEVDHVFSLGAAWDLGASRWGLQRRKNLAGDPRNLITTTREMNRSKGDKTPGEWMPPAGRCRYATTYLDVARAYDLPVTAADHRVLTRALTECAG